MKRTPLSRGKPLRRTKRMKQRNSKRLRERQAIEFGPQAVVARAAGCLVCGHAPAQAAHVRTRGASGKGRANIVGLCGPHHQEQEGVHNRVFEARYGVDLEAAALYLERLAYADAQYRQELVAEARQLQSPLGSDKLEAMTPGDLAAHVRALQEDL